MLLQDFEWFKNHNSDLYKKYGHTFLVIKNKSVIGSYNNLIEAVNETKKQFELGTFIVQECDGTDSTYTNYISSIGISVL